MTSDSDLPDSSPQPSSSEITHLLPAAPLGDESFPCPYLPNREATVEYWGAMFVNPQSYRDLMDHGLRRSGQLFYRNRCEGCNACVPSRVPVADFALSRSQRRVLARNRDVTMSVAEPNLTPEKLDVYRRYMGLQHADSDQGSDEEPLRNFLYESNVATLECEYRIGDRLVGVTILDVFDDAVSAVYHYFDPDYAKRSIGTLSRLRELEWVRGLGKRWYYLGFWVKGSRKMEYKTRFQPCQLRINGQWIDSTEQG